MVKGIVWDLTTYFNAFNSPEMKSFKAEMNAQISKLQAETAAMGTLDATNLEKWENLFLEYEQLTKMLSFLCRLPALCRCQQRRIWPRISRAGQHRRRIQQNRYQPENGLEKGF
jgi:hypothetical protein